MTSVTRSNGSDSATELLATLVHDWNRVNTGIVGAATDLLRATIPSLRLDEHVLRANSHSVPRTSHRLRVDEHAGKPKTERTPSRAPPDPVNQCPVTGAP